MNMDQVDHRNGISNILSQLGGAFEERDVARKRAFLASYENVRRMRRESTRTFVARYVSL